MEVFVCTLVDMKINVISYDESNDQKHFDKEHIADKGFKY